MKLEKIDEKDVKPSKYDYLYEQAMKTLADKSDVTPISEAIDWGTVINVGKKVWEIVEKNQPTLQVQTSSASALPGGISDWKQMAGWQTPRSVAYRIYYENLFTI